MKILYVGNMQSPFIQRDYEILQKHFNVDMFDIKYTSATSYINRLIQIGRYVKRYDLIFSWFANWHSAVATFYAKKYRKKSIVVAGGYDVVCLPEIKYGSFSKIYTKIPAKYALKNADLVLSVSRSNQKELLEKVEPKKNMLVYNGVDIDRFYPKGQKEDLVITVGAVNPMNWKRKGIDFFVKVASYNQIKNNNLRFIVVGKISNTMKKLVEKIERKIHNITFTGYVSDEELLKLYQKARVYCQLSMHEGFGVSVAEAMACGCIPVVTNRGALPEVVGDVWFCVEYGDVEGVIDAIHKAENVSNEERKKIRQRIVDNFSLERRKKCLVKILKSMERRDNECGGGKERH